MKHITTQDALRALEEAVAEKGEDYVYDRTVDLGDDGPIQSCVYVDAGAPSCLVGHALHLLGVPLDLMADHEGEAASQFRHVVPGERAAWTALDEAQKAQDNGKPWGEALRAARKAVAPDA